MTSKLPTTGLAGLLRMFGATIVVAGMCLHLLEGWSGWDDLSRYYAMLIGTGVLALAAFVMTKFVRDVKSARVFLALGLLSVVANVTTLGGLLHSQVQWDQGVAVDSIFSGWTMAQGASFTGAMLSALVVLIPVIAFAYRVLARPAASELSALFGLMCGLIVVPLRESAGVGVLILAAVAIPAAYAFKRYSEELHFATGEGRFALATLFAPALIMIARLLWLYEADALLVWILSVTALVGLRLAARLMSERSAWLAYVPAIVVAFCVGLASAELLEDYLHAMIWVPVMAAITGGLVWDMVRDRGNHGFAVTGAFIVMSLTALNTLFYDEWQANLICALLGVVVYIAGHRGRSGAIRLLGAGGALFGFLPRLWDLIERIDLTNWLTLGVLGVLVIVAAGLVERWNSGRRDEPNGGGAGSDDVAGLVADEEV